MARVTGPALSVEALGPLGGALTYSRTQGGRVAKLTPRRTTRHTPALRAARAALKALQHEWTRTVIDQGADVDWQTLGRQKNLPPYNAYLSDALERTRAGLGPRLSPTQSFGDTFTTLIITNFFLSANTLTLKVTTSAINDCWLFWIYLSEDPLFTPAPNNIVTSIPIIGTTAAQRITPAIRNLQHGHTYYEQSGQVTLDGSLMINPGGAVPITIP